MVFKRVYYWVHHHINCVWDDITDITKIDVDIIRYCIVGYIWIHHQYGNGSKPMKTPSVHIKNPLGFMDIYGCSSPWKSVDLSLTSFSTMTRNAKKKKKHPRNVLPSYPYPLPEAFVCGPMEDPPRFTMLGCHTEALACWPRRHGSRVQATCKVSLFSWCSWCSWCTLEFLRFGRRKNPYCKRRQRALFLWIFPGGHGRTDWKGDWNHILAAHAMPKRTSTHWATVSGQP